MEGFAIWRLKEGIELKSEDLTYFSPGGFTFTHKSGENIAFDFEESRSEYEHDKRVMTSHLYCVEHELITDWLEQDELDSLVQEEYDLNFFRNGKIDLSNNVDEMHCTIDVKQEEVPFEKYFEPVYMSIFDPNKIGLSDFDFEFLNKLTDKEYDYFIR